MGFATCPTGGLTIASQSKRGEDVDLSEEEQKAVWEELDRQCRERLGKGCEELLSEARKRMNTD